MYVITINRHVHPIYEEVYYIPQTITELNNCTELNILRE